MYEQSSCTCNAVRRVADRDSHWDRAGKIVCRRGRGEYNFANVAPVKLVEPKIAVRTYCDLVGSSSRCRHGIFSSNNTRSCYPPYFVAGHLRKPERVIRSE